MNFTCVKSRHKVVISPVFWGAHQRHEDYLQGGQLIVSWCIGHFLEMLPPDAYDAKYKMLVINGFTHFSSAMGALSAYLRQGLMGTVEILLAGAPSISFRLMAI